MAVEKGFYCVTVQVKDKVRSLMMYGILLGIFLLCLFPVWPLQVKIGVFYTSVVLLYFLLGLIFVRLVIYCLVRILGFDFWLLPNLFAEVGFLDSFKPVISWHNPRDSWKEYLMRAAGLVVVALVVYKLVEEPEIINGR